MIELRLHRARRAPLLTVSRAARRYITVIYPVFVESPMRFFKHYNVLIYYFIALSRVTYETTADAEASGTSSRAASHRMVAYSVPPIFRGAIAAALMLHDDAYRTSTPGERCSH
jgi:hypothetical protein